MNKIVIILAAVVILLLIGKIIWGMALGTCPVCGNTASNMELDLRSNGVCEDCHFRVYRQALKRERVGHVSGGVLHTDAVMCDKEMKRQRAE